MKVLLMSPYPPDRCGIASYAAQVAATLRRQGHTVEVVSPRPSAAGHWADYSRTARGVLRALALSRRADRTVVEFFPDLVFLKLRKDRFVRQWAAVALLFGLGRRVELVIHEAPFRTLIGRRDLRGRLGRAMWRTLVTLPSATYVHTAWERTQLAEATGADPARIGLLDHGESFLRRTGSDRERARRELGMKEGEFHFLSIGFLQPHKGFDRAMRALAGLEGDHVRLDVVGSMRFHSPDVEAHVETLRRLAAEIPRVTLHEGYVSDELFDRWIVACDAVVLPYREIWSSGVLARAKLYGRPAIVSDVGGLRDQAGPTTHVVGDDGELCAAMARLAGARRGVPHAPAGGEVPSYRSAMEVVRRRGAALRERWEPGSTAPETPWSREAPALPPRAALPEPPAGRGLRAGVKRAVDRLTRWELAPLVGRVNDLRDYVAALGRPADLDPVRHELDGLKEWTRAQIDEVRAAVERQERDRAGDAAPVAAERPGPGSGARR